MTLTNPANSGPRDHHADLHDHHARGPSRTHTPLEGVGVRSQGTYVQHRPRCHKPPTHTAASRALPGLTITRCPECGATAITRDTP